jgi:hypothetical protein
MMKKVSLPAFNFIEYYLEKGANLYYKATPNNKNSRYHIKRRNYLWQAEIIEF